MALVRCPDCGTEVSDGAAACPKCARPIAGTGAAAPAPPGVTVNVGSQEDQDRVTRAKLFTLGGWLATVLGVVGIATQLGAMRFFLAFAFDVSASGAEARWYEAPWVRYLATVVLLVGLVSSGAGKILGRGQRGNEGGQTVVVKQGGSCVDSCFYVILLLFLIAVALMLLVGHG